MSREVKAPVRPPNALWSLTDGGRATGELAWFAWSAPWLATREHRGDGRPVLVLPGFLAGDGTTVPLRRMLGRHGYFVYGWGQGRNLGPTPEAVDGLEALFREIRDEHDGAPVSLIGQSLGGIFALELARRFPGDVDRIISLGSPVSVTSPDQSRAKFMYSRMAERHLPELEFSRWTQAPLPEVRATSIFSRLDGICRWETCLYPRTPLTENIEVYSSHLGMAVQPAALYATLDRLAAPLDEWAPFDPPCALRSAYPGLRDPMYLSEDVSAGDVGWEPQRRVG
ncbi:triacylglycerol lipase [Tsukamurella sp. 1534]|uniref:esterase/lipase family protein n=1 Tax=Tsukamurella sp. 1534 TaxID=1151061 RepID=UPI0002FE61D4|nr:alpha/beta fold hydrolase [Tsukamurella sp. 1534]